MINVGILGAGGIAALSHLPEIAAIEGMRVTHICGRRESRLRALCRRLTCRVIRRPGAACSMMTRLMP